MKMRWLVLALVPWACGRDFNMDPTGLGDAFSCPGCWDVGGDGSGDSSGGSSSDHHELYVVNSDNDVDDTSCDATHCSLREAINAANRNVGLDSIHFDIPGPGPHTIQPTSALPEITDPVIMDGYTEPGASPNYNGAGLGSNATLKIELDGTEAGASADGLSITGGGSTVRGLVVNRFGGAGIAMSTHGGNAIEGVFVGSDVSGTRDLGNDADGIRVGQFPSASDGLNRIGGVTPEARNLISGNESFGIVISGGTGNVVQNNLVGTDVTGAVALGNALVGVGVSTSNTTVGGAMGGARNVISANGAAGVQLSGVGQGVSGNVIQGNFIGTDVSGTRDLGNGTFGLSVFDNTNTLIGGAMPGAGNVLSGNGSAGIHLGGARGTVIQGNVIGTDATGTIAVGNGGDGIAIMAYAAGIGTFLSTDNDIGGGAAAARNIISANGGNGVAIQGVGQTGNRVQGNLISDNARGVEITGNASGNAVVANEIFANAALGIDLGTAGVTPNDARDGDSGANDLQNFPVLASAISGSGSIEITGFLNSTATTDFRLEFFATPTCDPSGNGEGERFLGSGPTTTDGGGNVSFTLTLAGAVAVGQFVTATATDPGDNTSEFSQCVAVE